MPSRTGGELLVEQLIAERVTTVFGVPGIQLDNAVDGLAQHRDDIDFVVARHEQGATYMADGYARVSGRPGVCMVVPGPGILNAGAALSTAYATNSRVVCITGQIPSPTIGKDLGMLHEINGQTELLRSLTKWTGFAHSPEEVPAVIREAFHQVNSGRPRPVAVEIPPDVLKAVTAHGQVLPPAPPEIAGPDPSDVGKAVTMLSQAQRPVIIAGGGIRDAAASSALVAVAESLGAPVIVTRNGKGALSDRHPLALSRYAGRQALEDADVVFAVGTRFITLTGEPTVAPSMRQLVGLNIDESDLESPRRFDVKLVGDAQLGLEALARTLHRKKRRLPDLANYRTTAETETKKLNPQLAWLHAIREALPDDGVFVEELTQVGYAARVAYPVYEAGTYVTPGYQGTLGYGFPTGLGAAIGKPDSPVISINGDGGFGWALQELSTAAKYSIPLITVIFRNDAFGNVERIQFDTFGRNIGVDLANPDFLELARAFGVESARVETPDQLEHIIRKWSTQRRPLLIEVPIGDVVDPWKLIAEPSLTQPRADTLPTSQSDEAKELS